MCSDVDGSRQKGIKVIKKILIEYDLNLGLSNMCNIALVKGTKSSNILLKNHNYLLKSYIFNTKCSSFNTNLLF